MRCRERLYPRWRARGAAGGRRDLWTRMILRTRQVLSPIGIGFGHRHSSERPACRWLGMVCTRGGERLELPEVDQMGTDPIHDGARVALGAP